MVFKLFRCFFFPYTTLFRSMEGYCILNEHSKAYQKTTCYLPNEDDVLSYAFMAEHIFKLPIFYLEYSGEYGDPQLVQDRKSTRLNSSHVAISYAVFCLKIK